MIVERKPYNSNFIPSKESIEFLQWIKLYFTETNQSSPSHFQLLDHIFGKGKRKAIECHRGLGKSTIAVEYVILYLAQNGKLPNGFKCDFLLFLGDSEDNGVKTTMEQIAGKYHGSDRYKQTVTLHKETKKELEFRVLNPDGTVKHRLVVLGYGAKQNPRGVKRYGKRPQGLIADDITNEDDAKSHTERENIKSKFYGAFLPALDPTGYFAWMIGTPQHEDDILNVAIKSDSWDALVLPIAETFPVEKKDFVGSWENRFPYDYVYDMYKQFKDDGRVNMFFQEYMLQIINEDDQLFKKKYFKYFNYSDVVRNLDSYNTFTAVDLAVSTKNTADYTVVTTIAVDHNNNWFILDMNYFRTSSTSEKMDAVFDAVRKYKPDCVVLETVAYQASFKHDLEVEMVRRNSTFRIETSKKQNKEIKIQGLEPRYKAGTVWHQLDAHWLTELEHELTLFTMAGAKSKHDDLIDTLAMINEYAYPPSNYTNSFYAQDDYYEEHQSSYIIN